MKSRKPWQVTAREVVSGRLIINQHPAKYKDPNMVPYKAKVPQYMVCRLSIFRIDIMFWGRYPIFGYLDPWRYRVFGMWYIWHIVHGIKTQGSYKLQSHGFWNPPMSRGHSNTCRHTPGSIWLKPWPELRGYTAILRYIHRIWAIYIYIYIYRQRDYIYYKSRMAVKLFILVLGPLAPLRSLWQFNS